MTVAATRAPVYIVTRAPIENKNSLFKPVTNTVLPSAKVTDGLSSIYVPSKQSPVKITT